MSAHCSNEDSPVPSIGRRNVSSAPIPTQRPGDLIGTTSASRFASRCRSRRRRPRLALHSAAANKFTPFSGWSLHAAEALWLIIKNLDQDERNARGRLPPRLPPRARPTGRSRPERTAHQGIEKRTSAYACRCFERKNGWFCRAQFCTEMARSERFELQY